MVVTAILVLSFSALLCTQAASVNETPKEQKYDTIVVGLGAAGTAAASTLAAAGKKVLALEAQDRIGGRVNTVSFGDGVVELGAEWIHGQYDGEKPSPSYDAALKNNITLISQDFDTNLYFSNGTLSNSSLVYELFNFAIECYGKPPEEAEPYGQYITRRVLDYIKEKHPSVLDDQGFITEFFNFIDLYVDSYEAATSWNDITTLSKYETLAGDQTLSWQRYGYKTFFEIMLKTYNKGSGLPTLTIKLNTEVKKIEYSSEAGKPVSVTTVDGTVYNADNVIVTVSVGVLKERSDVLFSPKLPQTKITAIEQIPMGVLAKIVLSFDNQWWPKDKWMMFIWRHEDKQKVPTDDEWTTKILGVSPPSGSSGVLTAWTSGDNAKLVETLPEDQVKRKTMQLIRKFLGGDKDIPEPTAMLRTKWNSNPFTRGSYTYDSIDSPKYPTARSDLAAPLTDSSGILKVLFAGEATNPTHFSTVHGAAETGYREARRLLSQSE